MGLIRAAVGAIGGVLADQWRDYFYSDAIPADILAVKGQNREADRSSNKKASDNIISNGSVIAVADGQCMMIVEQGKIVEVCAEPGQFIYDTSSEPSIFYGDLGPNIKEVFKAIGRRIAFGADTGADQRVYFFNTKELVGNKYGTPAPIPFRVVDERAGIDIDIGLRCFGEYSYKLVNPLLFYTNVCGNITDYYSREELDSQLKAELLSALQPAFAKISMKGIRYSLIPAHTNELAEALKEELSEKWGETRGIEIQSIGVSSVTADEEDEKLLKDLQRNAAFMDPTRAAAALVGAQAEAMQAAASNPNAGAAMAFMGMNMAQNAGGVNAQALYQMGQQAPAQAAGSWTCGCGKVNTGKFCPECGAAGPAAAWTCSCGTVNTGKFCSECGKARG
ncbi:MAG: SPFH domain-containing protein [Firmicutes bacterium]|nr:SPFH domain-containing protein [Bacillota bacterium]